MKTTPKARQKMREHLKNSPKVIALIDDVEALEAKLAKAVGALERVAQTVVWYHEGPYGHTPFEDAPQRLREALSEIKGAG
jgi:hypothetical protein